MNNKQLGYTIFEMLLVISIMTLVFILTPSLPSKIGSELQSKMFFEDLKSQLLLAQDYSIMYQAITQITFSSSKQEIQFITFKGEKTYWTSIIIVPEEWHLFNTYRFNYLSNGHVDHFRTVIFINDKGSRVRLIFQMGSGKFEVQR